MSDLGSLPQQATDASEELVSSASSEATYQAPRLIRVGAAKSMIRGNANYDHRDSGPNWWWHVGQ
jgi:hypothetical protein